MASNLDSSQASPSSVRGYDPPPGSGPQEANPSLQQFYNDIGVETGTQGTFGGSDPSGRGTLCRASRCVFSPCNSESWTLW